SDSTYPELDVELDRIIAEINDLSQTIALRRVRNGETANFNVFLTDADTYGQFEANAVPDLGSNWGYVYVYWTGAVITRGSMYVDTKRNTDLDCMKHLLREELTQALGLLQDSSTHPESIFYQPWTCGFEYAEIDQAVIALLLSPNISAGDSRSEVRRHFEGN
ncbi:MAG: DUF2927 domain-containing protein, partial [Saprospiraceae bacterium]|nr:DUF2927 domain-containing protein [Saprospiraceae bacterium]